jgi:hypothetical protein
VAGESPGGENPLARARTVVSETSDRSAASTATAAAASPEALEDLELFRLSRDPAELLRQGRGSGRTRRRQGDYPLPSLELLEDVIKEERGFSREVLQMKARLLLETLAH